MFDAKGMNTFPERLSRKKYRELNHKYKNNDVYGFIFKFNGDGQTIFFYKIIPQKLELNLKLLDTQLPEILAYLVSYTNRTGNSALKDLLVEITRSNPLGFDLSKNQPFYKHKIKKLLTEIVFGMKSDVVWNGNYNPTRGAIIVKENGELANYHNYYGNEFQNYLVNIVKLQLVSKSEDENKYGFGKREKPKPYKYGWIYEEDGELFIKLNLQIRFT
ncbi:MAG: HpaII family restriction endonuclease [Bacteroidota bacterium]